MNARIAAAFLALLSSSGCLFFYPGGGGSGGGSGGAVNGNITFTWTFNGQSCTTAGVSTVRISIDGETLSNNGVYSCLTDNYPGIQLNNFRPRTYTYSITGYDSLNQATYETAGNFTVNGDISVNVDLDPVVQSSGYAYLQWTFPANSASNNPTCAQAGVSQVFVSIDNGTQYSVTCSTGQTSPGAQTSLLSIGTHNIDLWAADSTGYVYYSKASTIAVTGNGTLNIYAMDWAVGGASLAWTLVDGSIARTCAQAGVTTVTVNFQDTTTGTLLYGANGDPQPCSAGAIVYDYLTAGTYKVIIDGYAGSTRYTSNTTAGVPTITVQPGVFKDSSQATNIVMYRVN